MRILFSRVAAAAIILAVGGPLALAQGGSVPRGTGPAPEPTPGQSFGTPSTNRPATGAPSGIPRAGRPTTPPTGQSAVPSNPRAEAPATVGAGGGRGSRSSETVGGRDNMETPRIIKDPALLPER